MITDDLKLLENADIYSLSMFMLFKLIDDPEYTYLSELPYVLDQKNMISLCESFGGQTIKIPTVEELYSIIHVLLLYQYVNIEKMPFEQAVQAAGYTDQDMRKVRHVYSKISKVLDKYEFKPRKKNK